MLRYLTTPSTCLVDVFSFISAEQQLFDFIYERHKIELRTVLNFTLFEY